MSGFDRIKEIWPVSEATRLAIERAHRCDVCGQPVVIAAGRRKHYVCDDSTPIGKTATELVSS